jgi:hypothetical protein
MTAAEPLQSELMWWTRRRIIAAVLCATALAGAAFVYRFNALDGSLGGFTNDQFADLMRAEMIWRGEQPLRDFADAELRGAWPALSYAVPAWVQQLGGRTLLSEAYLTVGTIAVGHALMFLLVLELSKSWLVAFLATLLAIAMEPRLYSYQKILMLTAGAIAIRWAMLKPSAARLGAAAATTALATLFRHDGGVYVGVGMIAALVARDAGAWSVVARRVGVYVGLTSLCLLPSAIWVQVYEGIPSYVRNNLDTIARESERTRLHVAAFSTAFGSVWADHLVVVTYYAFWAVIAIGGAVLAARVAGGKVTPAERGSAVGLIAVALLGNQFLLRDSLVARFGDAVIPIAVMAAWTVGAARGFDRLVPRRLAAGVTVAILLVMLSATWVFADVRDALDKAGFTRSLSDATAQFVSVSENLRRQPPADWSTFTARGTLIAARYIAECTRPDDHVLVAAEAPEIPFYARRRFAAGQATVSLSMYTSEDSQRRATAQLASQSVPIILVNAERMDVDFVQAYPLLARYVMTHYRRAGTIDAGMQFVVYVKADRQPHRLDSHLGLPCFR